MPENASKSHTQPRRKIITDEPAQEDALDFEKYSQNLAEIIRNSTPRFTVGIFGGWGTGKTTLMQMIQKNLKSDTDILTVWFDAWKYEKEKYFAVIPFLRTIRIVLENNSHSKTGRWNKVKKGIDDTVTAFINSTNICIGTWGYGSTHIDIGKFKDILKTDGSVIIDNKRIYFHEHVTDYLKQALSYLRQEIPNARIVIFVDDLDRCIPEKSIEILESIKTFFDIDGLVYVIGMDSRSINAIIRNKYRVMEGEHGENIIAEGNFGQNYMEKLVQLPFQIPTWLEADVSRAVTKIITKELEKDSELYQELLNEYSINLITKAVKSNPRQVKRFVNNVILAK